MSDERDNDDYLYAEDEGSSDDVFSEDEDLTADTDVADGEEASDGTSDGDDTETSSGSGSGAEGGAEGGAAPSVSGAMNALKNPKEALQNLAMGAAADTKAGKLVGQAAGLYANVAKTASAVQSAITSAVGGAKSFIAAVANPVGLIVIASILVLTFMAISIVTFTQTLGKNPNANYCSVTDSGTVVVDIQGETWQDRAGTLASWLMATEFDALGGKPMSKEQAAGIIGNFAQESQLDPRAVQNKGGSAYFTADSPNSSLMKGSDVADGNAAGISQWDGSRRKSLAKFAEDRGKKWNTSAIQLEFLLSELNSADQKRRLSQTGFTDMGKDAEHYTIAFEKAFTRAGIPAYENRIAAAESFMAFYKGGYSAQGGTSCLSSVGSVASSCYAVPGKAGWCYPMEPTGRWTLATYGGHPFEARDISGPRKTPLYAVAEGTVVASGSSLVGGWCPVGGGQSDDPSRQYEIRVKMKNPQGSASSYLYAHLFEASSLKVGDEVKAGDFVGYLGNTGCSTGPHLHIEFTRGSGLDPASVFGRTF